MGTNTILTDDELKALAQLELSASPGPWKWHGEDGSGSNVVAIGKSEAATMWAITTNEDGLPHTQDEVDAKFVALIRNAARSLIQMAKERNFLRKAGRCDRPGCNRVCAEDNPHEGLVDADCLCEAVIELENAKKRIMELERDL